MQNVLNHLTDPTKIENTFKSLIAQKAQIELWQPINKNQKHRFTAKIQKLQYDEIFLTTTQKIETLKGDKTIYGYIQGSEIVFKSTISFHSDFKIALSKPEYLVYRDFRSNPRVDTSGQELIASYYLGENYSSHHRVFNYHSKILNKSDRGMAILIKINQLSQFYVNDFLTLRTSINSSEIKTGQIKHITPNALGDYTVGLMFV